MRVQHDVLSVACVFAFYRRGIVAFAVISGVREGNFRKKEAVNRPVPACGRGHDYGPLQRNSSRPCSNYPLPIQPLLPRCSAT